jgi:hypothetical protein
MLELIRRLMLVGGIAGFIILAFTTIPDLVLVAPVDFAAEMAREYRIKPDRRLKGVMELADEFIKKTAKPASLQEYINRKTEHGLIKINGADWDTFFKALEKPDNNFFASRRLKNGAYIFRWQDTPLLTLRDQIVHLSKNRTINYLALERGSVPHYVSVRYGYGYEPKKVGAPASLVFPWRIYCWIPLLMGVAAFAFLRRRPQTEEIYTSYLSSCLSLDLLGILFFSLFFFIPFWVSDPTQQMWGVDLGVTLLCWMAALSALSLVVASAFNASFAIRVEPGRLVISRLFGLSIVDLREIIAANPLLVGDIESGIVLKQRDHDQIKLPWANMVNYHLLIEALKNAEFQLEPRPRPAAETAAAALPSEANLANQYPQASGLISWDFNVPLLTDQFIMYDMLKVWGGACLGFGLIIGAIVAYERDWHALINIMALVGVLSVGVLAIFILVMLVFFGNRFPMGFVLGPEGAMVIGKSQRGRFGNRLAVILGALAGKPGVAGAGLLASARESAGIRWTDVRRVNIHPQTRVISLMNSWRVVIRIYCTPKNYDLVLQAVQKWAAEGLKKADKASRTKGLSPILRLGLKSFLAAVAAFLITALPIKVSPVLIWSLLAVGLGAIWFLAYKRFFGAVVLVLVSVILLSFVRQSLEVGQINDPDEFRSFALSQGVKIDKVPDWIIGKYRRFEHFHRHDWLQTGIAGLGLALFVWIGMASLRLRKRERSR